MVKINKKLSENMKKHEPETNNDSNKGVTKLKHKKNKTKNNVKKCSQKETKYSDSNGANEEEQVNIDCPENVPKMPQFENIENHLLMVKNSTSTETDNSDDETNENVDEKIVPVAKISKKTIDPEQNERTVFLGNIPSNTKLNQLKKLFANCEIVSCRFRLANGKPILKHKMRKESDSINAWVVFQHQKDAELAIKLNGSEFKGHHIRVTKSQTKTPDDENEKRTIFVGNLKYSANDKKLYSIFSSCGEIEFVRTINNEKGCSGVAYVCFKKPDSVGLALELNKTLLDDRPINVEKYSKNKSGASKKRKPEKKLSGVERRIMSKLMKDKNQNKNISDKLPYKNFNNKRGNSKKMVNEKNKVKISENGKKKKEFRGVKVDAKKKFKKKKNKNPLNTLAKKIAPKE